MDQLFSLVKVPPDWRLFWLMSGVWRWGAVVSGSALLAVVLDHVVQDVHPRKFVDRMLDLFGRATEGQRCRLDRACTFRLADRPDLQRLREAVGFDAGSIIVIHFMDAKRIVDVPIVFKKYGH